MKSPKNWAFLLFQIDRDNYIYYIGLQKAVT